MQTEVISTEWDEDARRWFVTTNRQDCLKARFVVHSNGPLNRPKLPAIKGISSYRDTPFTPAGGITPILAAIPTVI